MKNTSILIKNAEYVVTVNSKNEILKNASILIEGNLIKKIGEIYSRTDKIIDAMGCIVVPGFINCHHHMFQCSLRGMPTLQNQKIEKWINIVCRATRRTDKELIYYSALANMAELMLYGCTTTTDMLYLFPKREKGFFEAAIQAAKDIGMRFHPYRGSMSLSKKDSALFPDDMVQDSDTIASDSERLIRKYNDDSQGSMLKIGLAPCTIFTSTFEDYRNAVLLSKRYGLNMQTHVAESQFENEYSVKKFRKRPLAYLRDLGWEGKRVSFAHCINLNNKEIQMLASSNTHVVHCPISNARSPVGDIGIAPISEMLANKVNVAIGTDGSAGNDSSNVLEELRWARTLQGIHKESTYLQPMQTLAMGTINGAKLLNWDREIGSLEDGKAADLAIFDLSSIEYAGINDPVTALLSCQAKRAHTVLMNGRIVVEKGFLSSLDEESMLSKYKKLRRFIH